MTTSTSADLRHGHAVGHWRGATADIPAVADRDAIDAVRFLAADAVERAGSGHPGTAMALAPLAYRLFTRHLRHDPADPGWLDRDRFVLSAGHASLLQYAALHLSGYDLSLADLRAYRQLGSRTPGHPERGRTPGIEVTTGPLGQGIANAVGLTLAERMLAARFNRPGHDIIDHRTWVIAGDGDLMEGVSSEAASLAGVLGLDKLTVFYDDNHISIEGSTSLAFCEQVDERFRAYGWHVARVADVNDLDAIDAAVDAANLEAARPTLVIVRSHIGYGSPEQDSAAVHGAPLGADAVAATRRQLGWDHAPFEIPDEVYARWRPQIAERAATRTAWRAAWEAYQHADPLLADELHRVLTRTLPAGWHGAAAWHDHADGGVSTRKASGAVLNALAAQVPELVGGSADLAPSTLTTIDGAADVAAGEWAGRNLHFGVREHAMGAILNGMAAHGGFRPYGSTFLAFSDYQRPAIRLAAMMRLPVVFVFTHDSIGLGEDGPTHQPIEQLASLRAIPGLTVIRPADANETALAWAAALTEDGPTALILSRQRLPVLGTGPLDVGGAVVADGSDAAVIASGSEVEIALAARRLLAHRGVAVRVLSMPSWERFRRRPASERSALLPPELPTVAVEAGSPQGWREFADATVGLDRFGVSAPGPVAAAYLGITPLAVADRVLELLATGSNETAAVGTSDDELQKEGMIMEIRFDATVECTDGPVGTSEGVVIEPTDRRATHLVVRDREVGHVRRLVPLDRVRDSAGTVIRLDRPRSAVWVTAAQVSRTGVAVHRGADVFASDGRVGHLDRVLIEAHDDRVTHLVVRAGHLWWARDVLVPRRVVADTDAYGVSLDLTRHATWALPSVPVSGAAERAARDASVSDLVGESPDAAGVAIQEPDSAQVEGARLLGNEARETLRARGFTDEQIREWAEAFIVTFHSGDVEDLFRWMRDREHASAATQRG